METGEKPPDLVGIVTPTQPRLWRGFLFVQPIYLFASTSDFYTLVRQKTQLFSKEYCKQVVLILYIEAVKKSGHPFFIKQDQASQAHHIPLLFLSTIIQIFVSLQVQIHYFL